MGRKEGGRAMPGEGRRRVGSPLASVCMQARGICATECGMQQTRVCICAQTRQIISPEMYGKENSEHLSLSSSPFCHLIILSPQLYILTSPSPQEEALGYSHVLLDL